MKVAIFFVSLIFMSSMIISCAIRKIEPSAIKPPTVEITIENLPDEQQDKKVRKLMKMRYGDPVGATWTINMKNWGAIEDLHNDITNLVDNAGSRILVNLNSYAKLAYGSARSLIESSAKIKIEVQPSNAKLIIVTPVHDAVDGKVEGEVKTVGGVREFRVPFSYLQETKYIYYYTEYQGLIKYYRFVVRDQKGEGLPVNSEEKFNKYIKENPPYVK